MLDVDVVEANDIAGLDCIRRSGKPFSYGRGGDAPMLKLQSEIIAAVVAVIVGVVLWRTATVRSAQSSQSGCCGR